MKVRTLHVTTILADPEGWSGRQVKVMGCLIQHTDNQSGGDHHLYLVDEITEKVPDHMAWHTIELVQLDSLDSSTKKIIDETMKEKEPANRCVRIEGEFLGKPYPRKNYKIRNFRIMRMSEDEFKCRDRYLDNNTGNF